MCVSSTPQSPAQAAPLDTAEGGGPVTLPALLQTQARRYADKSWVQAPGGELRYEQAPAYAARWAALLADLGVTRGDRVALMMGNRLEFLGVVLGCGWLGAVAVPINTASRGMQLEHILSNSAPVLAVADAPALAVLAAAAPRLALRYVGQADAETPVTALPLPPLPDAGIPAATVQAGDTLAILYTSGTSGLSKGVCCPQAQFYWWGVLTSRNLGMQASDVLYTALPLFHTNALNACFQALVTGASIVCDVRFSVSRFFERLAQTGATLTYLLGAMVPMLLARGVAEHMRGHRTRLALAPGVPPRFHETFMARTGMALLEGYGSTETNFALGGPLATQRVGYMGPVMPEFEAYVADEQDRPVADGIPGELLLRPREPFSVATGYFGMPDKTVEVWRNLWFHTGDRVVRDAQGYYRFLDRMKDAIRRRGENISSYEVEQVLLAHPAVEAAAVYAVQAELGEDEVMAALLLRSGHTLTPAELLDFCQTRMPYFAVPRYVRWLSAMPRTENGKIRKYGLREEGITVDSWDREAAGYALRR